MSSLNYHIEEFFGNIGEFLHEEELSKLKIQCSAKGVGLNRKLYMNRKREGFAAEYCEVFLYLTAPEYFIKVRWDETILGVVSIHVVSFQLDVKPEVIGGFMLSRFQSLE